MRATILGILISMVIALVAPTVADDGVLVIYGDHFEMVCRDDGLVDVYHSILETTNITKNVRSMSTYSFDGTLVGPVSYESSPEIYRPTVVGDSKDGTSTILVDFNATLKPPNFAKLKLAYTVKDLLKEVDGTWHFKHRFNYSAVSAPEVLLKIPKPSTQFEKLIVEDTIPAPHVFMEESRYYVLVWKSPLVTIRNFSVTYIDVSYKTVADPQSYITWFAERIAIVATTAILTLFGKRIWKKLRSKVRPQVDVRSTAKKGPPKVEPSTDRSMLILPL